MKVLIQTRPGLGGVLTGDVTQVRKTAEALEALGVDAELQRIPGARSAGMPTSCTCSARCSRTTPTCGCAT